MSDDGNLAVSDTIDETDGVATARNQFEVV
jgi:hypothetical protein